MERAFIQNPSGCGAVDVRKEGDNFQIRGIALQCEKRGIPGKHDPPDLHTPILDDFKYTSPEGHSLIPGSSLSLEPDS